MSKLNILRKIDEQVYDGLGYIYFVTDTTLFCFNLNILAVIKSWHLQKTKDQGPESLWPYKTQERIR